MLTNAAAFLSLTPPPPPPPRWVDIDSALQYHLSAVEKLVLQNTSSIYYIVTKRQGRHHSRVQKSYQGHHLWLGRRQTNLLRADDLLLNWYFLLQI